MRGPIVAALGLIIPAPVGAVVAAGPIAAHAPAAPRADDDDDERPRGPRLAPGKALGLALTLSRGDATDTRAARLVALHVPSGAPPSPFLAPGPFRATWEGDLAIPSRGDCTFSAAGRGSIRVEVAGKVALAGSGDDLSRVEGRPTRLRKGANRLVVTYDSPPSGDAEVRLSWSTEDFAREPVPPVALRHDADFAPLVAGLRLREGRELLAGLRCLKCHAPDAPVVGEGSMPELAMDAPDLADVGARLRVDWMARWIEDPRALRPSASMPRLFHAPAGQEPDGRSRDIAAYLATLGAPAGGDEAPGPAGSVEAGGRLFANLGCVGCHTLPDRDDRSADLRRIPLRYVGAKWRPGALVAFLRQPDRHFAWIRMPNFRLSPEEAGHLAAYLASPPAVNLSAPGRPAGDPARGRALLASTGCLNCHALPDTPGAARPKPFAAIPADPRSPGCLAPTGALDRRAPDFALSPGRVEALQAIAKAGLGSLARESAVEFADRRVKALNCAACHRRDGSDDAWADLKVEVDKLLVGPSAEEKDPDGLPFPAAQERPSLTWIGEKLRPEWAAAFIAGKVPDKPRPFLKARMPAFPVRAEALAVGLALEHGFPPTSPADPAPDLALIPVARQLVKSTGLNCVSCHNIGKHPAVGVFEAPGVNFMHVKARLRKDYYDRWVRAPIRVEPETRMPAYFNGEASVLPTILEGNADRQIGALWNYLLQGEAIEPPGN